MCVVPMEEHVVRRSLVVHPDGPAGKECPGCQKAGLRHQMPCGPRNESLRLLALIERQRAGLPAKVEPGRRPAVRAS